MRDKLQKSIIRLSVSSRAIHPFSPRCLLLLTKELCLKIRNLQSRSNESLGTLTVHVLGVCLAILKRCSGDLQ